VGSALNTSLGSYDDKLIIQYVKCLNISCLSCGRGNGRLFSSFTALGDQGILNRGNPTSDGDGSKVIQKLHFITSICTCIHMICSRFVVNKYQLVNQ
jgi:hypothetical protein